MLCKVSPKKQITLPKEILTDLEQQDYFEVRREGLTIILDPVLIRTLETASLKSIRDKIAQEGISEDDIQQYAAEFHNEYNSRFKTFQKNNYHR